MQAEVFCLWTQTRDWLCARKDAVRRRILLAVQIAFGVLFAAGFIGLAVTMWGYHKGEQSYADLRELVRVPRGRERGAARRRRAGGGRARHRF